MASDRQFLVQPLALRTPIRKQVFARNSARVASAGLTFKHFGEAAAKVREAGTLPRSPRFIWRAATPEAPQDWPSGTDSMLFFAARAPDHATLNRRLALSARIGERWC